MSDAERLAMKTAREVFEDIAKVTRSQRDQYVFRRAESAARALRAVLDK